MYSIIPGTHGFLEDLDAEGLPWMLRDIPLNMKPSVGVMLLRGLLQCIVQYITRLHLKRRCHCECSDRNASERHLPFQESTVSTHAFDLDGTLPFTATPIQLYLGH